MEPSTLIDPDNGPSTSPNANRNEGLLQRSRREVSDILFDQRFDRPTRLLRLQGWRSERLQEAVAAGGAHRLAPGFCAVGAAAVAVTGAWGLALAFLATAVVGIFARNHPVETMYNQLAPRLGRTPIPRNRAAKRLGCVFGTAFFGASALAGALGAPLLGQGLAATFALIAGFVTVTNFCVPSAIFISLFGSERSTADRLI